jgi:hypothetical protein
MVVRFQILLPKKLHSIQKWSKVAQKHHFAFCLKTLWLYRLFLHHPLSLECLDKHFSFSCRILNNLPAHSSGQKFHEPTLHDQPDGSGNVKEGGHPNLDDEMKKGERNVFDFLEFRII